MSPRCLTCGNQEASQIHELVEIAFGEGRIHICEDCMARRETKRWNARGDQGQQLLEELPEKRQFNQRRYSYLVEPEQDIHLLRLRQDWVQEHLQEA